MAAAEQGAGGGGVVVGGGSAGVPAAEMVYQLGLKSAVILFCCFCSVHTMSWG